MTTGRCVERLLEEETEMAESLKREDGEYVSLEAARVDVDELEDEDEEEDGDDE